MSVPLIHLSIASGQESLSISAGHQLIRELWHGGTTPSLGSPFPGCPVVYPVLAAIADSVGGLAAARLMSLVFMLCATLLLYGCGRRLFGYWPGVAGAGLLAALGLTHYLGASATPGALALALLAAAAYAAARASAPDRTAQRWLLCIPALLLAANMTDYASLACDPLMIGAAAALLHDHGWRRMGQRAVALGAATCTALGLAVVLAGASCIREVWSATYGTGAEQFGPVQAAGVTSELQAFRWIGLAACLAAASVLAALAFGERHFLPLLALLALAGPLAIADVSRLHAWPAIATQDGFAAWFACLAAGYLAARMAELTRSGLARALVAVLAAVPPAAAGLAASAQGADLMSAANAAIPGIRELQPLLRPGRQHYLITSYYAISYELRPAPGSQQVMAVDSVAYPVPGRPATLLHGTAGLTAAIDARWFALVSLPSPFSLAWTAEDQAAYQACLATSGYRLIPGPAGVIFVDVRDYQRPAG
jgi:hypothetical protein